MDGKVQGGRKPKNWSPQQGRVWDQEDTSWSDVYGGARGGSREILSESMGMPRVTVRVCTCVRTRAWVCICECQACGCVKSMCDHGLEAGGEGATETGARKWSACPWSISFCPHLHLAPPTPCPLQQPDPSLSRAREQGHFHLQLPAAARGPCLAHPFPGLGSSGELGVWPRTLLKRIHAGPQI